MQTFVIAQCDFFSFYHIVVKEIFEQALLAHNLPLTIVVGLFMLYWILSMVGVFAVDSIDFDMDIDADGDSAGHLPSPVASALQFVNAADVPLMVILSFLSIFMWAGSMMANYYFNPQLLDWLIIVIFFASFVVSVILVKIITKPLVPIFKKMKELEKAEPAVGGTATVISKEVDGKYGQAEQKRSQGAPAILTCITTEERPIPRGTEVAIISYDKETGIYKIRTL